MISDGRWLKRRNGSTSPSGCWPREMRCDGMTNDLENMMRQMLMGGVILLACTFAPRPVAAQDAGRAAVLATVRGFHEALARSDSMAAMRFLAPDVRILEAGGMETREEYRTGHLAADIAFSAGVPSTASEPVVTIQGDVAWVIGTSRSTGTFRGRAIDSAEAELMVLSRGPEGWRIRAIHWSSRNIRPPAPPAPPAN